MQLAGCLNLICISMDKLNLGVFMKIFSVTIFAIVYTLLITQYSFAQWVQTNGLYGDVINCLASSGTNIFAGTDVNGVYLSTNNGENWAKVNFGLSDSTINAFAVVGERIFIGTGGGGDSGGVFFSTNSGTSWSLLNNGLPNNVYITSLAVSGTNIFAGTLMGGVYLSTNNGKNWSQVNNGLPTNSWILSLVANDTMIFAGTQVGVFLSTNNGTNWTQVNNGLTNSYVNSLALSGKNIFAGTSGDGVYLSQNNGISWLQVNNGLPNNSWIFSFAVSGTNIFIGTYDATTNNHKVYLSTNNGAMWSQVNNGLPTNINVNSLDIIGPNIFVGTAGNGVWRCPLSEIITAIEDKQNNFPISFSLQQNYPNPFNPTTTINYSVPKTSFVTLKVYDVLGKEITTLVNHETRSGNYSVEFNASKFISGVYYYRMQAGSFVETKKLIVLK